MTSDKARKGSRAAKPALQPDSAERPLPTRAAEPPVSETAIVQATGRGWDEWLGILDARGIDGFSHSDTAAWLVAEHGITGWWSQTVTVGFERARGLRAVYQTTAGWSVGVSKTLDLPLEALYGMVVDEAERDRWLLPGTLRIRTATPHKSARFDFRDGPSRVAAGFATKSPSRSTISVQHEHLAGPDDVEAMRTFWHDALTRLATTIRGPQPTG